MSPAEIPILFVKKRSPNSRDYFFCGAVFFVRYVLYVFFRKFYLLKQLFLKLFSLFV